MFKILPLVCLLFTSLTAYSFSLPVGDFSTKKIVRAKLWYEGIDLSKTSNHTTQKEPIILPEEISIPLELLDS